LSKRSDWIDRPSVGIPYLYVATGLMLSEVLQATGDMPAAARVMSQARDIAKGVKLNDLLGQLELAAPQPAQNPLLAPPSDTQRKTTVPVKKP
jgi:hypothetical protein